MPETTPTPLRLTVRDIFDLYWLVTRRVSNESQPKISNITADIAPGIYLTCMMGDYRQVQINACPGYPLSIDVTGVEVSVKSGADGLTFFDTKVDGLPVCWVTRQGTGPTIVGGGQ
jgi:hypothetical protein